MQNLDVISVNIWQMAVSLANLVILFLIVKHFLYKPVKNMLEMRRKSIDADYSAASDAKAAAEKSRVAYDERLAGASMEADSIIKNAAEIADARQKQMIEEAGLRADAIVKKAEADALLEKKKAEDDIKRYIVEVSTMVSSKILERDMSEEDHARLVDSFIDGMDADANDD